MKEMLNSPTRVDYFAKASVTDAVLFFHLVVDIWLNVVENPIWKTGVRASTVFSNVHIFNSPVRALTLLIICHNNINVSIEFYKMLKIIYKAF